MSFTSKLLKIGAVAGAVFAAKKVNDKYKEKNPYGVPETKDKVAAYKDAAMEVGQEASASIQNSIPGLKQKVSSGIQSVADFAAAKVPSAADKIQSAVDSAAEFLGQKAPIVEEKIEEVVDAVAEKVAEVVEGTEAAEESFEDVVDAAEADICAEPAAEEAPAEEVSEEETKTEE